MHTLVRIDVSANLLWPPGLPQKPMWTSKAYPSSVQALAFSPSTERLEGGKHLLAVGLEDGSLEVLELNIWGQDGRRLCSYVWQVMAWGHGSYGNPFGP